ncbi:hypothetical protein PF008_g18233 [Phytophthora fragariae]|uniref:Uncharacterized protein n=1 Tax=Phytophthora fragariae TaxID=53985 RepID=A0A6G0R6A1_9STRA|nr:hypothetical protein PF008_g18233 [Phytophthora fragariae]
MYQQPIKLNLQLSTVRASLAGPRRSLKLLLADICQTPTQARTTKDGGEGGVIDVEKSLRAVLLEELEITEAAQLLEDDDSDAEDSGEGLFRDVITSYRYLTRSTVFKAAHWTPGRIFRSDPMRARRDLRMSRGTFIFLLSRIQEDVVFARAPTKQEQAPVQLQLEVFLFALQSLSSHRVAQHFGIAEGDMMC